MAPMKYLLPLLLLVSCAHTSKPTPLEIRCRPLLSEIIAVQDERSRLSDEMNGFTETYRKGGMSSEEHLSHYHSWLASENRLRGHVTGLYDRAYGNGCLSQLPPEGYRDLPAREYRRSSYIACRQVH